MQFAFTPLQRAVREPIVHIEPCWFLCFEMFPPTAGHISIPPDIGTTENENRDHFGGNVRGRLVIDQGGFAQGLPSFQGGAQIEVIAVCERGAVTVAPVAPG